MDQYKFHTKRLRAAGLRSTKQRLAICKMLFDRKETFHFTIENLKKILERESKKKISVATLYNTVHAFKKKGYLREISLKGNKTFFDTNTENHHHFYDEGTKELTDINYNQIKLSKVPVPPKGKKIKNLEVVIRIQK